MGKVFFFFQVPQFPSQCNQHLFDLDPTLYFTHTKVTKTWSLPSKIILSGMGESDT